MKKNNSFIFLLLFLSGSFLYSQENNKVKIRPQDQVYFFKIGEGKDSLIVKDKTDLFYYKISDNKKPAIELRIYNATFQKTNQETVFKLIPTPGMKYRFVYTEKNNTTVPKGKLPECKEQIEVDGTTEIKEIKIELFDLKTDKVVLTNTFIYKEN